MALPIAYDLECPRTASLNRFIQVYCWSFLAAKRLSSANLTANLASK
jgi:hypothetical protein